MDGLVAAKPYYNYNDQGDFAVVLHLAKRESVCRVCEMQIAKGQQKFKVKTLQVKNSNMVHYMFHTRCLPKWILDDAAQRTTPLSVDQMSAAIEEARKEIEPLSKRLKRLFNEVELLEKKKEGAEELYWQVRNERNALADHKKFKMTVQDDQTMTFEAIE